MTSFMYKIRDFSTPYAIYFTVHVNKTKVLTL